MKRLLLLIIIILTLGTAAAVYLVPWNRVLEQRITAFLNAQGMSDIAFEIDKVGFHKATLSNIVLGKENPLLLQSVTVEYSPREVAEGNFQNLNLNGLDVQIMQTDEGWKIAGFESFTRAPDEAKPKIGLTELVDMLPFAAITVTDSNLRITGNNIQTALPFAATLTKAPDTSLEMTINASNITSGKSGVDLGVITVKAAPDEAGQWKGNWTLASLDAGGVGDIPVMSGAGTLAYGDTITGDGTLSSADKTYNASFKALYDGANPSKNAVTITSFAIPFKEGRVSAKNVVIPFDRKKNITVNVDVNKVSIDALMQTLTGSRVTATGTVSGSVPVILKPDGSFGLGKGTLKADSNGTIQMPGEIIPGDNAQVAMVRELLEDLHYKVFSAGVDTTGGKGIIVRLSLEGNNPAVYGGRAVILNVNLTGDILDFIQQNAMLFTNPEKLLEQGTP